MPPSNNVEELKDVVILGQAAPEEMSDKRRVICTGAWSEHRGFIRLYPVEVTKKDLFKRWNIVNLKVKRNSQDTRHESWKLAHRDYESCIEHVGEYPRDRRATLLHNLEDDCVEDINEAGRSLGIVRPPETPELDFQSWEDVDDDTVQSRLFEDSWMPDTREEFNHEIRVKFSCPDCKTKQGYHDKTLLEWGAYVGKSKGNITEEAELEKNYRFHDDNYRHWVFVGNQANQRTSFIAINLLWMKDDVPIYDSPWGEDKYRKVADDFVSHR